jgi:uncharacterized protein
MEGYWGSLLMAVALMLGPKVWRDTFRRLIELSDGQLRFIGLLSMAAGLLLLFLVT